MNFRTNNIQRAQINSAGLFGINTTNQETHLDVRSSTFKASISSSLEYLMQIGSANSSSPLAMRFGIGARASDAPSRYGAIQMEDGSFRRPLILNPDGGNVGVNWNNPLSPLDVRNNINKGDNVAPNFPLIVGTANNAPLAIRLGLASSTTTANRYGIIDVDDAGTKMNLSIQPNGGNTAVNWTSPEVKLDVRSDADKTVAASTDYAFQVGTSNNDPLAVRLGITGHNTASSRFGVIEVDDNGTKRDLIFQPQGGNVGIGVNGIVGSKLYVNDANGDNLTLERSSIIAGHIAAQYFKVHTGTTSGNRKGAIFFQRTAGNGRGSLIFATNDVNNSSNVTTSDARMTITVAGNVGIGLTNPQTMVHVSNPAGEGSLRLGNTDQGWEQIGDLADFSINRYFNNNTSNVNVLTIKGSNTFVGIGTTNPDEKLDINGNLKFSGGIQGNYVAVSDNFSLDDSHYFVHIQGGLTFTLTLPDPVGKAGKTLYFRTQFGLGTKTIQSASGNQIRELGSPTLVNNFIISGPSHEGIVLLSDGAAWNVISRQ